MYRKQFATSLGPTKVSSIIARHKNHAKKIAFLFWSLLHGLLLNFMFVKSEIVKSEIFILLLHVCVSMGLACKV